MGIKCYQGASGIPEKYLSSLEKSEIECWGSDPFNEYRKCINEECGAIYGIEEVHGSIENFRNKKVKNNNFCCNECDSETELIYKPGEFLGLIKEYIKGEVSAVLLIENEKVEGFGVLSKGKLSDIMYSSLNSRPDSWDLEDAILSLSEKLFGTVNGGNKEVVCSHQIYVSPEFRKGNITLDILKKLFSLNKSFKGLPIVGETRFDSKFYPITRAKGYKDLLFDKYGSVLQYAENFSDVNSFYQDISSFSDKGVFSEIIKYKRESKKILSENLNFSERKFYI